MRSLHSEYLRQHLQHELHLPSRPRQSQLPLQRVFQDLLIQLLLIQLLRHQQLPSLGGQVFLICQSLQKVAE